MGQETYECTKCKAHFQEPHYEEVPDNMSFSAPGLQISEEKGGIPKCPHCGELHFFGFNVIDIAF